MQFFNKSIEDTLKELNTTEIGLSTKEAETRLERDGKNRLSEGKKESFFIKFLKQFKDIMVIILLIAAGISVVTTLINHDYSNLFEGGVILFIVIVNALMGVIQENKAENALESLKKSTEPYCRVMRDGEIVKVKTEDLVKGDVVVLEAGDIVPSDMRLLEAHNLKIDEASLTGESVPVEKESECVLGDNVPLSERKNMAYSGSVVTYGRGVGVIVCTGTETEMGKISVMLTTHEPEQTPLQKSLSKIGKIISIVVLIISFVIFLVEILNGANSLLEAFLTAVALAVAAIPESLPAVVTIIMALSVQKLASKNAIIKKLHAVETLGSCSVICSDKTGTLTQNKMTVKELYYNQTVFSEANRSDFSNECFKEIINCMVLNNDSKISHDKVLGDPTETALIHFADLCELKPQEIIKNNERIYEVPFDSNRKLMTTVNVGNFGTREYCKGAFDNLIKICSHALINGQKVVLTQEIIADFQKANENMANKALRVLGLAYKPVEEFDEKTFTPERELVFLGLVGMIDPPRVEAKEAIKKCFTAGLKPVMITGDHKDTAYAIAKELGIASNKSQVISGVELDKLDEKQLNNTINNYTVFARVSPEHKVRIVKAFKKLGKIVAMTGDGVNDAPSLKIADIGVGMGITGTDVTKDVADMIVSDDNFATIIVAVEEGRKIYSNIQKTIQFLLSTNVVEVLTIFLANMFLPGLKFLIPAQILFINLVTDSLPAISLGLEPTEKNVMNRPPRKNSNNIIDGVLCSRIIYQALIQTLIIMLEFVLVYKVTGSNEIANTMTFYTLNLIQVVHSINLKTGDSIFTINPFKNKAFNISFLICVAMVALLALVPFLGMLFGVVALSFTQWLIVIGCALLIIPLVELGKLVERLIVPVRIR